MGHQNKNAIVNLFYHELSSKEEHKMRDHLTRCENCQEYLNELKQIDSILKYSRDERPLPGTFDEILERIPVGRPRVVSAKPEITALPFFRIGFAMLFILSLIYFVQDKISLLPFWQSWQEVGVIQAIGSFGFVAFVFLGIGTFITLALAPILYFDIHRKAIRF
jgi:hypothetical protein